MRKLALVGAIGAAAALVLAGCSTSTPAEEETGDIRVWLVGTDTPQDARDYLKKEFEKENPGSTLTIEEQQWTGLVDLLTTSLSSSDSPDVVEVGNTQAAAFTSAGAFLDISDMYDSLGGDDLLPGFVEAGSYDGKFYAAPYYSGARIVFYNTTQYDKAGVSVPTTLDDYVANAVAPYDFSAQMIAQLWGVGTALVWSGVSAAVILLVLKYTIGVRSSDEAQEEGLDIADHGEKAYNQ